MSSCGFKRHVPPPRWIGGPMTTTIRQSQTIENTSTRVGPVSLNSYEEARLRVANTGEEKRKREEIVVMAIESTALNWNCHPGWMSIFGRWTLHDIEGEIDKGRITSACNCAMQNRRRTATANFTFI